MDVFQHPYSFAIEAARSKWRALLADGGQLLEKEFRDLRKIDMTRISIATNPANKSKNRYALVFPYDEEHCRVRLTTDSAVNPSEQTSDYINASFVRCLPQGYVSAATTSRVFYAAQGPTQHTLDDFIRMIVEQQISIIVMLSYTYDPITCIYAEEHVAYFAHEANKVIDTAHFQVQTTSITPGYRHIGRRLRIRSKLTNVVHECEHFHYPHFIDKGIPPDCHSMIDLIMRIREPDKRHLRALVHCSAGIGRTGVFIALYYLISAFEQRLPLNIKKLVDTMRRYRAHLVQTLEQYEFIYRCMAEMSIHPYESRLVNDFVEYFHRSLPMARQMGSTILTGFDNCNERVEPDGYLTTRVAQQHPQCNRNERFVPSDHNRVMLHSLNETTYINASIIPNIAYPTGTILTQEPMRSTLKPFLFMLLQRHKTFIVAVEQMNPSGYANTSLLGDNDIEAVPMNLDQTKNKFGDYFSSHKMRIRDRSTDRDSDVFIFEYLDGWTDDGTHSPRDLEHFARFVDRAVYHQRKLDPTRLGLVVHDRDGGTRAAFYCMAQNLFDRLLLDGRVALENVVTSICQQRMNALVSLEQYIALHQIVCIWHNLKQRGALLCTETGNR